ncbi:PrsW family intramembrane metalloprotease [Nonomuraea sp. NPDC049152]|uniref:PrsW family intramembrane metalloprotease n=1 Tax=Nonomuraea sp. NPDC049152 TaxID=3154350 RepID=UPI0033C5CBDC
MGICGLCALLALGYQLSWLVAQNDRTPAGFALGLALAVVLAYAPVLVLFIAAVALDRRRLKPWPYLAFVFGWGAGIAAFFAVASQSWAAADLQLYFGLEATTAEMVTSVVLAPPTEEVFKATALLALLWQGRRVIASLTDGIVYAAVAGLGFGATENALYYLIPIIRDGAEEGLAFAAVRGPVMLLMHPLWSSVIGLGVACTLAARGRARYLAMAVGYAGAALLHWHWNYTVDSAPVSPAGAEVWSRMATWMVGMGRVYLLELLVFGALIAVTVRERRRPAATISR